MPNSPVRHEAFELYDLVRITESDLTLGEESFRIRVEVTRSRSRPSSFRANIWAAELYRIQSTFPQREARPEHRQSDQLIWVSWTSVLRRCGEQFQARSVERAEDTVLSELAAWVRHSRGDCERKPHAWGECRGS